MRTTWTILVVLLAAQPVMAEHLVAGDGLIVPGSRVGPVYLGMDRTAVDALNEVAACPVMARYESSGKADLLITEWGGGCRVSPEIQVGLDTIWVLANFGRPEDVLLDAIYEHNAAMWLIYGGSGIAFRVLIGRDGSALVQAIAVFPAQSPAVELLCHLRTCTKVRG